MLKAIAKRKANVNPYYKHMITLDTKVGRKSIVIPAKSIVYLEYHVKSAFSAKAPIKIIRKTENTMILSKGKIIEIPYLAIKVKVSVKLFNKKHVAAEDINRVKISIADIKLPFGKNETRYSIAVREGSMSKKLSMSRATEARRDLDRIDTLKRLETGSSKDQVQVLDAMVSNKFDDSSKGSKGDFVETVLEEAVMDVPVEGEDTLGLGTSGMSIEDEILAGDLFEGGINPDGMYTDSSVIEDDYMTEEADSDNSKYLKWGALGLGAIALVLMLRRK